MLLKATAEMKKIQTPRAMLRLSRGQGKGWHSSLEGVSRHRCVWWHFSQLTPFPRVILQAEKEIAQR